MVFAIEQSDVDGGSCQGFGGLQPTKSGPDDDHPRPPKRTQLRSYGHARPFLICQRRGRPKVIGPVTPDVAPQSRCGTRGELVWPRGSRVGREGRPAEDRIWIPALTHGGRGCWFDFVHQTNFPGLGKGIFVLPKILLGEGINVARLPPVPGRV